MSVLFIFPLDKFFMYSFISFFTTPAKKYTPTKLATDIKNIIESDMSKTEPKLTEDPIITKPQNINLKIFSDKRELPNKKHHDFKP